MSPSLSAVLDQALALPVAERAALVLRVWESLSDSGQAAACPIDPGAPADARRRDVELSSGAVTGRMHDEVMSAARRALR